MNIIYRLLGCIPDAPNDGRIYARKNGEWVAIDEATDSEVTECVEDALRNI